MSVGEILLVYSIPLVSRQTWHPVIMFYLSGNTLQQVMNPVHMEHKFDSLRECKGTGTRRTPGNARPILRGLGTGGLRSHELVGNVVYRVRYKTLRGEESNKETIDGSFYSQRPSSHVHPHMHAYRITASYVPRIG